MALRHFSVCSASSRICSVLLVLLSCSSLYAQSSPQPTTGVPSFNQVHRLTDYGKFDEALSTLEEISKADPNRKNLAHEFGAVYYRKGDYINAVKFFERAIKENPEDSEAT